MAGHVGVYGVLILKGKRKKGTVVGQVESGSRERAFLLQVLLKLRLIYGKGGHGWSLSQSMVDLKCSIFL
jgi:hypothetical protein